jgi:hypothetical protein
LGILLVKRFVLIEDVWVNPDAVCLIDKADPNEEGMLTELVHQQGKRLLKTAPVRVAALLNGEFHSGEDKS